MAVSTPARGSAPAETISDTYDGNGVPLYNGDGSPTLTTRTEQYTYDSLSRLKSVDYGDGQAQAYSFDPMGNRTQRTDSVNGTTGYAYNAANMLLSSTGAGAGSYTSDADGNTLSGGGRTNAWDSQNRLVSCSFGGNTSSYVYGADGLRRQGTVNGSVTNYAYDGQGMVRELSGSLSPRATYLTGARGPEYRRDDTQTEPDGQGHTFGRTRWYVYDGLGSVLGEVDPLGNMTASDKYDVYGGLRGRSGTTSTKQGFVGSLGHLSEPETGLVYMRARYYDPSTGRFASEDPKGQGGNWFAYCGDNPVNKVDKSGKSSDDLYNILAVALIGLGIGAMYAGWTLAATSAAKFEFDTETTLWTMAALSALGGGIGIGAVIGMSIAVGYGFISIVTSAGGIIGGVLAIVAGFKLAEDGWIVACCGEDGWDSVKEDVGDTLKDMGEKIEG